MERQQSAFWDDLQRDLEDPEYRRAFILEAQRIATIDRIINALRSAGEAAGMPKQAVAEASRMSAPALRRLLSAPGVNPTLTTLSDVAAAVGLKVELVPMTADERRAVTEPLVAPVAARPRADTRSAAARTKGGPAAEVVEAPGKRQAVEKSSGARGRKAAAMPAVAASKSAARTTSKRSVTAAGAIKTQAEEKAAKGARTGVSRSASSK